MVCSENDKDANDNLDRINWLRNRLRIKCLCKMLFAFVVLWTCVASKLSLFEMIKINRIHDFTQTSYVSLISAVFLTIYPQILSFGHKCYRTSDVRFLAEAGENDNRPNKAEILLYVISQSIQSISVFAAILYVFPNIDDFAKVEFGLGLSLIPALCRLLFMKYHFFTILNLRSITNRWIMFGSTILSAIFLISTIVLHFTLVRSTSFGRLIVPTACVGISFGWLRFVDRRIFSKKELSAKTVKNTQLIRIVAVIAFAAVRAYLSSVPQFDLKHLESIFRPISLHISSSLICFVVARASCKVNIDIYGYMIPLALSSPATIIVLLWHQKSLGIMNIVSMHRSAIILCTGFWICQTFLLLILKSGNDQSLKAHSSIFAVPSFESVFVEQSLIFNRISTILDFQTKRSSSCDSSSSADLPSAQPLVYICATLWHETEQEMQLLLQSIERLNTADRKRVSIGDSLLFDYEFHLFFDDAFTDPIDIGSSSSDPLQRAIRGQRVLNQYVNTFMSMVKLSDVGKTMDPVRLPTPYGGRLLWTFPNGQTKMVVHLKDKLLCRNKKRWSQVMYMFYFLRYLNRPPQSLESNNGKSAVEWINAKLNRVYILAIDGDVDFQPESVELLVERMNKNSRLGSVCGQIHPTGSGPLIWLQQFEYAIGHWMQKAAEHKLGSVLCSPGCFSLFRASALNDDNVILKYASDSVSSSDYIQFDQGEDRWLCTLLLKRGYLVEYCAASMAYTHAPETLTEFFNQRRRWIPSTMANLADLICNYKVAVRRNTNISRLYILYLAFLFVSTMLGPATIVITISSAFRTVFTSLTLTESYIISLTPTIFYVLVCLCLKPSTQLITAGILSSIYSLVMAGVIVATIAEIVRSEKLTASSVFLPFTSSIYIAAGLFHFDQIAVLVHGLFYLIALPATYLLLVIYSLCSMNVVQWGTRENAQNPENHRPTSKKGIWAKLVRRSSSSSPAKPIRPQSPLCTTDSIRQDVCCSGDERYYLIDPLWLSSDDSREHLSPDELSFWHETIKSYLSPIVGQTEPEKVRMRKEFKKLRDRCCIVFFMLNLFWIVLQYQFEYVALSVDEYMIRFSSQVRVGQRHKIQLLGLVYMSCFVVTLCLQFWGMLLHRWSTLLDVLANTRSSDVMMINEKRSSERPSELSIEGRGSDPWNRFSLFGDEDDDDSDDEHPINPTR